MQKNLHALIIEDSEDDTLLLINELNRVGYTTTYKRVETARELIKALESDVWDIIFSDHSMPDFSAPRALEILDAKAIDVPFIIVSGKMSEDMAVTVMKGGAHDYVPKNNLARLGPVVDRELAEAKMRRERIKALSALYKREDELSKINKQLKRSLDGTVRALSLAVEKRDPYTAGHQLRVTELAMAMSKEMSLDDKKQENIYSAGILHDIGKISVPAEILTKPGRLTKTEFKIVQNHAEVSYEILKEARFTTVIAKIAHQHHERLNGSGYPRGLTQKEILYESKILAVADVVEAMASHRPYRAALRPEIVIDEISKNKGILYDAKAVDVCILVMTERNFQFIHGPKIDWVPLRLG